MRKIGWIIIICAAMMLLISCNDANEVDDLTHVITIGVDRGVSDKWRLTVQFPNLKDSSGGDTGGGMQKGSSGGGGDQVGYTSVTIDAPSFFTAIDMLNVSLSRRLNFMHTENLIISEDLAESGSLGEFLAPIIRFRQIRRSLHIFVTKGSAMDFIEATKPSIGATLSKNMEIMVREADTTGFFPHVTLNDFYDGLKSTYREPIAALAAVNNSQNFIQDGTKWGDTYKTGGEYYAGEVPRTGSNKIEFFGAAVFDGDKMVGELNGEETRLMQIVSGKLRMAFFTMQDPKEPSLIIPFDVRQSKKPEIKINFSDGKPVIHLKVELEGDILAIQSRINYENPELKSVLERAFEQQIKNSLDKLMEKSKSLKTDIFGFGRIAARQFLTIQEWESYNWVKEFQNAQIITEVKFTIRRTGTQLKSSPIINTKGNE